MICRVMKVFVICKNNLNELVVLSCMYYLMLVDVFILLFNIYVLE